MARRQSSPFTGKRSAGPDSTWAGFSTLQRAFATIPSHHPVTVLSKNTGAPSLRFRRHGGIYQSDVAQRQPNPGAEADCLPLVGPESQVEERAGRNALSLIVQMSSGRLFLDRVGRHQSPSPLHRHGQDKLIARSEATNYHRTVSSVLTVPEGSRPRNPMKMTPDHSQ